MPGNCLWNRGQSFNLIRYTFTFMTACIFTREPCHGENTYRLSSKLAK